MPPEDLGDISGLPASGVPDVTRAREGILTKSVCTVALRLNARLE